MPSVRSPDRSRSSITVLSPTVQHSKETNLGAQVLGISGDGLQGFCRALEENIVKYLLVLVSDRGDLFWHGEDNMKIWHLEKLGLPFLDPFCFGQTLAFGAVPIPATIERIAFLATLITAFEVAAQGGCAAHLDGGHDAPLRHRHGRAMLLSISFSVAADHVRHFQLRTVHGGAALSSVAARRVRAPRVRDEGAGRADWRPSTPCW